MLNIVHVLCLLLCRADEGELELSYMQGEHSGVEGEEEVDDGARFYGTLEDSRED
jgi:hypothetical protein